MTFVHETVLRLIARMNSEEEGQGLVEYGLIIALIAVVCIAALAALGTSVSGILTTIAGAI